jgi:hypothetical protein
MTARTTCLAAAAFALLSACAGSTGSTGTTGTAPAPSVAAAPKPFEFAASTGQYRFSASSKIVQSMMGQSQDMATSNSRLMTIALARSAPDTITMSMTIDSITLVGAMGMTPPGLDKVPGSKFVAKIAPNGTFYSVTGPSETDNPLGAGMTDELGRALPRIKAILAAGATWTDTVKDRIRQSGLDVEREIITTYVVTGDSTVGGEASWKVSRSLSSKGTAKGSTQGQDITLESSGTGKGMLVISKKGVLMSGTGEETGAGLVTLVANGMQVNINSTTTTSFTKVK